MSRRRNLADAASGVAPATVVLFGEESTLPALRTFAEARDWETLVRVEERHASTTTRNAGRWLAIMELVESHQAHGVVMSADHLAGWPSEERAAFHLWLDEHGAFVAQVSDAP